MSTTKVLVLGGTGMLGSMLVDVLSRDEALSVSATGRDASITSAMANKVSNVEWWRLDAWNATESILSEYLTGVSWVVNAIGITKPLIFKEDAFEIERAVRVNSLFPYIVKSAAEKADARVIQIATDCVYSGKRGGYSENDTHDPSDVYGKSKSLGEVPGELFYSLRCSIIGPEPKSPKFLLEWFLGQAENSQVDGYENHDWNGVTTLQFSKVVSGLIKADIKLPNLCHLVGADKVTKAELLNIFADTFDRQDIRIQGTNAQTVIDRTLTCGDTSLNNTVWATAGYESPPTIEKMVRELSAFDYRFAR